MKLALLCGGPSLERGISLNSARSVLDHLLSDDIEIVPVYFDAHRNAYKISSAQLYSSTPSDFDFKLHDMAELLSEKKLISLLKQVDITFPVMHGKFGEDGGIQNILEDHHLPFIGSNATVCKKAFDKYTSNKYLSTHGFFTLPCAVLKIYHRDHRHIIEEFFNTHKLKRAIVKPASGGSSIGVFSVSTPYEALEKVALLFSKRIDTRVVIEPFATGIEFTNIILQNSFGIPVALPPTEIETDYSKHQIFDFRRKYLPTRQVVWHCPPRFDDMMIEKIQAQAEQLFALFGMRDFARFDGWVLSDGTIWFCDFNIVSGMEQNSFLFQQSSRIGMTHADTLRFILKNACRRYGIRFQIKSSTIRAFCQRKPVCVLFGGSTSERQVSLMSGTNVWLKLRSSKKYVPHPFLLDIDGHVWKLPYHLALNHTVEEISENCSHYLSAQKRLETFEKRARIKLALPEAKDTEEFFAPVKMKLNDFIKSSDFVFNALHGGFGEDGTLQALLARHKVIYNGPGVRVSRLCMDKWATSKYIKKFGIKGVDVIPNMVVRTADLMRMQKGDVRALWKKLRTTLGARTIVIKPRSDGCSTGVVHLYSSSDLYLYSKMLATRRPCVPLHTFKHQNNVIEMPPHIPHELLCERFIDTDVLRVIGNRLKLRRTTGWIEITVGVFEINGALNVLPPSITVTGGEVLSVEEKFQGGTGINITPPPTQVIRPIQRMRIMKLLKEVVRRIGITGYSRIDAFVHRESGDVLIIEINTLPALTPSTVLYHQALANIPIIFPKCFLEMLIQNKGY